MSLSARITNLIQQGVRRWCIIGFGLIIAALVTAPQCFAQKIVDVGAQVKVTKSGLVFNRLTNTFNSEVSITNISANDLNGPLLLRISNLTPATVTIANQAGTDASGNPYIYVFVPAGNIPPGKGISNILLKFNNPNRQVFTFVLSVSTVEVLPEPLADDVSGPFITSLAPTAALVGKLLKYQPMTSSNNPTSLAFSLSSSPLGMTIDPGTGLVKWTPTENQVGDQSVTIVAQDSGGQTSQTFTLSCFGARKVASVAITAATGGLITVNDPTSNINGLAINIPAGALSANTTIVVSQLITPPTFGGASRFLMKGFTVDPDGTTLSAPATIKIPYSLTEFSTTEGIPLEDFLGVYFLQPSTGIPESLNSFLADKVNHVISGTVSHFSTYLTTNIARLCAPLTVQPACPGPMVTSTAPPSLLLPVVLVHGFQAGLPPFTLGDESTWGKLRSLLGDLDSGDRGRIEAWRFDWDSSYTSFERSAANLSTALSQVESSQSGEAPHLVNIVAHSFGGLLTRTYLESMANPGLLGILEGQGTLGNLLGIPYRNDVNRVMTLGTPHQGIGGPFSTFFASACAVAASIVLEPYTCYEADSGGPSFAPNTGMFARTLNLMPVPPLQTSLTTQYEVVIGKRMFCPSSGACSVQPDDGLITTAGNQLCGGSLVNPVDVCGALAPNIQTEINPGVTFPFGLCHSGALIGTGINDTCQLPFNIAMADVEGPGHPLWSKICDFLGCKPAINVTVSDPSKGNVTSDPQGINCGPSCAPAGIDCGSNCTALFDAGTTVTLTATPASGSIFLGWLGECTGTALTCVITIDNSREHLENGYVVIANFDLPAAGLTINNHLCAGVLTQVMHDYTFPDPNVPSTTIVFPAGSYLYSYVFHLSGTAFGPPSNSYEDFYANFAVTQFSFSIPGTYDKFSATWSTDGRFYYPTYFDTSKISGADRGVGTGCGNWKANIQDTPFGYIYIASCQRLSGAPSSTNWSWSAGVSGVSAALPSGHYGIPGGISWHQIGPYTDVISKAVGQEFTCPVTFNAPVY